MNNAKDIGELMKLLAELVASGKISTEDIWWGWDNEGLIIGDREYKEKVFINSDHT